MANKKSFQQLLFPMKKKVERTNDIAFKNAYIALQNNDTKLFEMKRD